MRFTTLLFVALLCSSLAAQSTTWTGAVDSDWHLAANWTNGVPDALTDAVIPAGTPRAIITSGTPGLCLGLMVAQGGDLDADGGLDAEGDVALDGTVTGTIALIGSAPATVGGTGSLVGLVVVCDKTAENVSIVTSLACQALVVGGGSATLGGFAQVGTCSVVAGAGLALGGNSLTANGLNAGGVIGGGTVSVGSALSGNGTIARLDVTGAVTASGNPTISTALVVTAGGSLTTNPSGLEVRGDATLNGPTTGTFRFEGSSSALLTALVPQPALAVEARKTSGTVTITGTTTMSALLVASPVTLQSVTQIASIDISTGETLTVTTGVDVTTALNVEGDLAGAGSARLTGGVVTGDGRIPTLEVAAGASAVFNSSPDVGVLDVLGPVSIAQGQSLAVESATVAAPVNGTLFFGGPGNGVLALDTDTPLNVLTVMTAVPLAISGNAVSPSFLSLDAGDDVALSLDLTVEDLDVAPAADVTGTPITVTTSAIIDGAVDDLLLTGLPTLEGQGVIGTLTVLPGASVLLLEDVVTQGDVTIAAGSDVDTQTFVLDVGGDVDVLGDLVGTLELLSPSTATVGATANVDFANLFTQANVTLAGAGSPAFFGITVESDTLAVAAPGFSAGLLEVETGAAITGMQLTCDGGATIEGSVEDLALSGAALDGSGSVTTLSTLVAAQASRIDESLVVAGDLTVVAASTLDVSPDSMLTVDGNATLAGAASGSLRFSCGSASTLSAGASSGLTGLDLIKAGNATLTLPAAAGLKSVDVQSGTLVLPAALTCDTFTLATPAVVQGTTFATISSSFRCDGVFTGGVILTGTDTTLEGLGTIDFLFVGDGQAAADVDAIDETRVALLRVEANAALTTLGLEVSGDILVSGALAGSVELAGSVPCTVASAGSGAGDLSAAIFLIDKTANAAVTFDTSLQDLNQEIEIAEIDITQGDLAWSGDLDIDTLTVPTNVTVNDNGDLFVGNLLDVEGSIFGLVRAAGTIDGDGSIRILESDDVNGGAVTITGDLVVVEDLTVGTATTVSVQREVTVGGNLVVDGTIDGAVVLSSGDPVIVARGAQGSATGLSLGILMAAGATVDIPSSLDISVLDFLSGVLRPNALTADDVSIVSGATLDLGGAGAAIALGTAGSLTVRESFQSFGTVQGVGSVTAADNAVVSSAGPLPNFVATGPNVTVTGVLDVDGNLAIASGADVDINNEIRVKKDVSVNGSFTGKIVMLGNENAVLSGDGDGEDLCVDKDNDKGVDNQGNLDLSGMFDLLDGFFNTLPPASMSSQNNSLGVDGEFRGTGPVEATDNSALDGKLTGATNVKARNMTIGANAVLDPKTIVSVKDGGSIAVQGGQTVPKLRLEAASGALQETLLTPIQFLTDVLVDDEFLVDPGLLADLGGNELRLHLAFGDFDQRGTLFGGTTRITRFQALGTRFLDGGYEDLVVDIPSGGFQLSAGSNATITGDLEVVQGLFDANGGSGTLSCMQDVFIRAAGELRTGVTTSVDGSLLVDGGILDQAGVTTVLGDVEMTDGTTRLASSSSLSCHELRLLDGQVVNDLSSAFPQIVVNGACFIDVKLDSVDLTARSTFTAGPGSSFSPAQFNPNPSTLRFEGTTIEQLGGALNAVEIRSAAATLLTPITVTDVLTVNGGATLSGAFDVVTEGDVHNDGDITGATIGFAATATQDLTGSGNWPDVTIDKPGEIRIDDDLQILGELGLESGTLTVLNGRSVATAALTVSGGTLRGSFAADGVVTSLGGVALSGGTLSDFVLVAKTTFTAAAAAVFTDDQHCIFEGSSVSSLAAPFRRVTFDRSQTAVSALTDLSADLLIDVAPGTTLDLLGNDLEAGTNLLNDGAIVGGTARFVGTGLAALTGAGHFDAIEVARAPGQSVSFQSEPAIDHLSIVAGRLALANDVDLTVAQSASLTGGELTAPNSQFVSEATVSLRGTSAIVDGTTIPDGRMTLAIEAATATLGSSVNVFFLPVTVAFGGNVAQTVTLAGPNLVDVRFDNPVGTTVAGRIVCQDDLEVTGRVTTADGFDCRDFDGAAGAVIDHGAATSTTSATFTSAADHVGAAAARYEFTGNGVTTYTGPTPIDAIVSAGTRTVPTGQTWGSLIQTGGTLVVPMQGFNQGVTLTITGDCDLQGGSVGGPGPGRLIVGGDLRLATTSSLGLRVGGIFTFDTATQLGTLELGGAGLPPATTPVEFRATSGTLLVQTLHISDARTPQANLVMDVSALTIEPGGELALGARDAALAGGGTCKVHGALSIGAGGELALDGHAVDIEPGGSLVMLGAVGNPASIAAHTVGNYDFEIRGAVAARNFAFSGFNADGVTLAQGASFAAAPFDFRAGRFSAPTTTGRFLGIESSDAFQIRYPVFINPSALGLNVDAPINGGTVEIVNAGGDFFGPSFEQDPHDRVEWISESTQVTAFTVTGLDDAAGITWTTGQEVDVEAFVIERALLPGSDFRFVGELPPNGPSSYALLDAPAPAGTFTWRLSERLTHGEVRELVNATGTVTTRMPSNVLTVGPGGFADIASALAASGPGSVIRVFPGSYPGFSITGPIADVRIFGAADGVMISGPIFIDGVPAGISVRLAGLTVGGAATVGPVVDATNCQGLLFLDDVTTVCDGASTAVTLSAVDHAYIHRCDLSAGLEGLFADQAGEIVLSKGALDAMTLQAASSATLVELTPTIASDASSAATTVPGLMADLDAPDFMLPGATYTARASAGPGETWTLLFSLANDTFSIPVIDLPFLLEGSGVASLGTQLMDGNGEDTYQAFIDQIAALAAGFTLHLQFFVFDVGTGRFRFSNADQSTITL